MDRPGARCTYCGTANADSDDHVPPKQIFPEPRPSTLITVPACKPCNKSFQEDDDVFTLCVSGLIDTNDAGRAVWKEKIENGLLKRSAKLKRAIGSTLRYQPRRMAGGRVAQAPTIALESERLLRVFRRIVRGLSWHEYRTCDFPDAAIEVLSNVSMLTLVNDDRFRGYGPTATRVVSPGVFEYDHATRAGNPNDSLWRLEFYETANCFVIITPEPSAVSQPPRAPSTADRVAVVRRPREYESS